MFHGEQIDAELKAQREKFEVQLKAQADTVESLEEELKQARCGRCDLLLFFFFPFRRAPGLCVVWMPAQSEGKLKTVTQSKGWILPGL